jgi:uncharacterized protein YggE
MISYQNFSQDWKARAAYCATLSVGALVLFWSVYLIVQTVSVAQNIAMADDINYGPSISVTGKGKAVAEKEDIIATLTFAAEATSESAESAQEESAKIVNAAMEFLKTQGIAEKDIETQSYSVYPHEEWIPEPCPIGASYCPGGRYSNVGFQVYQSILVKIRDTSKSSAILSGLGKKGVTNVSGLSFSIDEVEGLQDKARAEAIADAKKRAEAIAAELGVELGDIVGMYESMGGGYGYSMYEGYGYDMAAPKAISPDVPVGEQEVEISVDVQFKIKN